VSPGRQRIAIIILEKSDRPGGNIRTDFLGGYICERALTAFSKTSPRLSSRRGPGGHPTRLI